MKPILFRLYGLLAAAILTAAIGVGAAETSTAPPAAASEETSQAAPAKAAKKAAKEERSGKSHAAARHSLGHQFLMYLPNRVFDLLDLARVRVRVGPGFAFGVRVTRPLSIFMGGYSGLWAGLPGPRLIPKVPLPFGLESLAGVAISMANGVSHGAGAPRYGRGEVGVSTQILLVGVDTGVDIGEAFDLVFGFLGFDLKGDDL